MNGIQALQLYLENAKYLSFYAVSDAAWHPDSVPQTRTFLSGYLPVLASQRDALLAHVQANPMQNAADNANMLNGLAAIYDEAAGYIANPEAVYSNPALGGLALPATTALAKWTGLGGVIVGPNGLPIAIGAEVATPAVRSAGSWIASKLEKMGAWGAFKWCATIIGIGFVGGTAISIGWPWFNRRVLMSALDRFAEDRAIQAYERSQYQKDIAACRGDKRCEANADVVHGFYMQSIKEELGIGGSSCGILETPIGTLLGGLIGVGLGWAGLRRIMRL